MRLPVLAGRAFRPEDDENGAGVAIVSKEFARSQFPGLNAISHFT